MIENSIITTNKTTEAVAAIDKSRFSNALS